MKKQQASRTLALLGAGIALAGMMLTGHAQDVTLTGDPVADGYTFLGNLNDPGIYVSKFNPAGTGANGGVYTKSFILGANDTASSNMGTFGSTIATPKLLTTIASDTTTTGFWQVDDEIFSIGVVNLQLGPVPEPPATPPLGQMLFMGFSSNGNTLGHSGPAWSASTIPFSDTTSAGNGNTGSGGTGPGDLVVFNINGSTNTGFDLNLGFVQFKDGQPVPDSDPPQIGNNVTLTNRDAYSTFFNGAQISSGNAYFTTGLYLINKSEVERDWIALGTDLAPEPFADNVDFHLALFQEANNFNNGSRGVFFNVPTVAPVPEPSSIGLLAVGGMLLLARRLRKSS